MLYRFILVSDEVEDFRRDITIDSDASFFDLHEIILQSVDYSKDQITSFFICDEGWAKQTEITLIDMESSPDEDVYVMENSRLSELIDEERQKLIYVFEPLTDRCFFMELREILPGIHQDQPKIVRSNGQPPKQNSTIEELEAAHPVVAAVTQNSDEDSDFYDEFSHNDYNDEDLENLSEDNTF
jgi:hypothetical protein